MLTLTNPNKRNGLPAARMRWTDGDRVADLLLDTNNGPRWLAKHAKHVATVYGRWMSISKTTPIAQLMARGKGEAEVLRRAAGLGAPTWIRQK